MAYKRFIKMISTGLVICIMGATFISCEKSSENPQQEIKEEESLRGVWVSTVERLDFPSAGGLSADKLKEEMLSILEKCQDIGINTIFFQVRPTCDALYKSKLFPTSHWITGIQGEAFPSSFDPLEFFINEAHKKGIDLHAWINPYRVSMKASDFERLAANNPAKLHPEWIFTHTDGKVYFNPGIPEVQNLIIDGVAEIIENYEIDGIQFDDYFYPSDANLKITADDATFTQYGKEFSDKAAWRRNNVDTLVKGVSDKIKSFNKNVSFGISPCGIWANKTSMSEGSDTKGYESYVNLFADTRGWIKKDWIDYICPQVYWTDKTDAAPFNTVVDWWSEQVQNTNVKLYIGHAFYKVNDNASIKYGWDNKDEIVNQIKYAASKSGYAGSVFFRFGNLNLNPLGVTDLLTQYYLEQENTKNAE